MLGWHHQLNEHELEQTVGDSEEQRSLARWSPWRSQRLTIVLSKHFTVIVPLNPKNHLWVQFISVQSLSHVRLFVTPWTAECQASLSITNSQSLLKLMSIESVIPSNHLIHCYLLFLLPSTFPSIWVFSNDSVLHIRWPKYWSFSFNIVLPMNTQDWSPLGMTGWISLQSKGLSRFFSNTTVQKHQFFGAQLSLQCNSHNHTWPLEKT